MSTIIQTSDAIETSTMNYVVDMFGKSVVQMIQASLNHQTAIDELRAQIRSCQTQISNIAGTLEEFEDRMFVKLQEVRPTIYTRDGLPLDDALESLQNKITTLNDRTSDFNDSFKRVTEELDTKVDISEFETVMKESKDTNLEFKDVSNSVQLLQKELQKTHQENDQLMDRVTQMVKMQVHHAINTQSFMKGSESDENDKSGRPNTDSKSDDTKLVTRKELKNEINKLLKNGQAGNLFNDDFDVPFDSNDIEGTFANLQEQQRKLDEDYQRKKEKLAVNFKKIAKIAEEKGGDENDDYDNYDDISDEIEFESDFSVNEEVEAVSTTFKNIAINYDYENEQNNKIVVDDEEITRIPDLPGRRRNIGLNIKPENIVEEIIMEEEDELDENGVPTGQKKIVTKTRRKKKSNKHSDIANQAKQLGNEIINQSYNNKNIGQISPQDEAKIINNISSKVANRVENMLVDLISSTGVGGIKLDKNDAKQLVKQLSVVADFREELRKVQTLLPMKHDRVAAEKALQIRITRDEFFTMLVKLFPNNLSVKKMAAQENSNLPVLTADSNDSRATTAANVSRSLNGGTATTNKRNLRTASGAKTTITASLMPARDSRFCAFNKRFLNGSDGHYYYRDMSVNSGNTGESNNQQPAASAVVGAHVLPKDVTSEAAFDYQPYINMDQNVTFDKVNVPARHRSRTPPQAQD
ncbi:hypothetical protein TRFO_33178 [Tritrichomonas foetus]|uniref:Uncharacterized protein n=1 Tax=Tritrichomonas foetus TaxID=1144522 RepID=A0A1J4JP47_9EUKA|nr:hypothetical protein TRFO_33178 [Tritrichomonas foetus]|eukprot:OHT00192.1 hypothetical protein TRFO_33178 [Tritrichomonas foetus]